MILRIEIFKERSSGLYERKAAESCAISEWADYTIIGVHTGPGLTGIGAEILEDEKAIRGIEIPRFFHRFYRLNFALLYFI